MNTSGMQAGFRFNRTELYFVTDYLIDVEHGREFPGEPPLHHLDDLSAPNANGSDVRSAHADY
jgi:hypothetical protein